MDSRSDLVPIRLPTGEPAWVTPEAFNLISEREFQDSERFRHLLTQRNVAVGVAAVALFLLGLVSLVLAARSTGSAGQWPAVAAAEAASLQDLQVPLTRRAAPPAAGAKESIAAASEPLAVPVAPATAVSPVTTIPDAARHGSAVGSALRAVSEPQPGDPVQEIQAAIDAWAQSWAAQDVESYLSFYGSSFQLPEGMNRESWEAQRRQRLRQPERIAITVSDVETQITEPGRAVARFGQRYHTPDYRDWVLKTLELGLRSRRLAYRRRAFRR